MQSGGRDGAVRRDKLSGSSYSTSMTGDQVTATAYCRQVRHIVQRGELPLAKRRSRSRFIVTTEAQSRAAQCLLGRSCLINGQVYDFVNRVALTGFASLILIPEGSSR